MERGIELKNEWFEKFFGQSTRNQILLLIFISFIVNVNTLWNDYVLDDVVVLTQNSIVKQGVNGISELLTTNYVKGYTNDINVLSAGRYRPITLISFAIEYQFFGAKPFVSHLINLLLYLVLNMLLIKLLRVLFNSTNGYFEFFVVLLFSLHPIHSEVLANVKSRDEILAFIFLISASLFFIKSVCVGQKNNVVFSIAFFFLALLTKETAITFVAVFPLIAYYFFHRSFLSSLKATIPLFIPLIIYLVLRYLIVGIGSNPVSDVTNSPYILASAGQAFATKIFVIVKYIGLLILPITLTSEYGYNQIPYLELTSMVFIVSLFLIFGLIGLAFFKFKSRSVISFSILYFLITLSVGTNLIFDFGAPLAERMLFLPSLSYCIVLVMILSLVFKNNSNYLSLSFVVLLVFYSFKTISRNAEWKNNETLFFSDIKKSPNSSRLNLFVCEQYILKASVDSNTFQKNVYLDSALLYGTKSLQIQPNYSYSYLRIGLVWFYKGDYYKAGDNWIKARKLDSLNADGLRWTTQLSEWFIDEAEGYKMKGDIKEAMNCLNYAIQLNPDNKSAISKRSALISF